MFTSDQYVLFSDFQFLRDVGKAGALGDTFGGGAGRLGIGEINLQDMASLRRYVAGTPFFINALDVRIGDFHPARLLGRDQRHDHELAILRCAEEIFAFLEVFRQHLWGRGRNFAGLGAVEQNEFDRRCSFS